METEDQCMNLECGLESDDDDLNTTSPPNSPVSQTPSNQVAGDDLMEEGELSDSSDTETACGVSLRQVRDQVLDSLGLLGVGRRLQWRGEALHVRGVSQLCSSEVLEYFGGGGLAGDSGNLPAPAHVEWLTDDSCNVVWLDDQTPLLMLERISSPVDSSADSDTLHDSTAGARGSPTNGEESVSRANLPPGRWRLGIPHPAARQILMRFATRADKRLANTELCGSLCKIYGDTQVKGVSGILTRRRQLGSNLPAAGQKRDGGGRSNPWSDIAVTWATAEAAQSATSARSRDLDRDLELELLNGATLAPRLPSHADSSADTGPRDLRSRLNQQRQTVLHGGVKRRLQPRESPGSDLSDGKRLCLSLSTGRSDQRPSMHMYSDDVRQRLGSDSASVQVTVTRPRSSPVSTEDVEPPANIKITCDFDDDELSEESSESPVVDRLPSGGVKEFGEEEEEEEVEEEEEIDEENAGTEADTSDEEAILDRRTDKNSSSDLRALLIKRRAQKQQQPVS